MVSPVSSAPSRADSYLQDRYRIVKQLEGQMACFEMHKLLEQQHHATCCNASSLIMTMKAQAVTYSCMISQSITPDNCLDLHAGEAKGGVALHSHHQPVWTRGCSSDSTAKAHTHGTPCACVHPQPPLFHRFQDYPAASAMCIIAVGQPSRVSHGPCMIMDDDCKGFVEHGEGRVMTTVPHMHPCIRPAL